MGFLSPYIKLARVDRPIGTWLLLWPCWWSAMAADGSLVHFILFALGAFLMRGAGCVYNDLVDHRLDAKVERTKIRPLPAGEVSRQQAIIFFALLILAAAMVLFQFNDFTIMLGLASLVLVAIYPFMKKWTYWPQLFLGLAFSWGALMGGAASLSALTLSAGVLYLGTIFWVIGYDTIYALQDKEDDQSLGVKSTALLFGPKVKSALTIFYSMAWILMAFSGFLNQAGIGFYSAFAAVALHFSWQIIKLEINNPKSAGLIFQSNRDCGALIFAAFAADRLIANIL